MIRFWGSFLKVQYIFSKPSDLAENLFESTLLCVTCAHKFSAESDGMLKIYCTFKKDPKNRIKKGFVWENLFFRFAPKLSLKDDLWA